MIVVAFVACGLLGALVMSYAMGWNDAVDLTCGAGPAPPPTLVRPLAYFGTIAVAALLASWWFLDTF
jgi:hypothetical protein